MATDTRAAILDAVVASPDDDLPRMAMADWCEEHGDDARAEFIHAQIELARLGDPDPPACGGRLCEVSGDGLALHRDCRPFRLRRRTAQLLDPRVALWVPPPFSGMAHAFRASGEVAFVSGSAVYCSLLFRRGFVAEVTLPCDLWLAHGPALVRAAPLERVTLSDKTPLMNGWEGYGGPAPLSWQVPAPLYRLLRGRFSEGEKRYRGDAAALAALSGACLAWARGEPGPLPASADGRAG